MAVELKIDIPMHDAALAAELCGEPRLVKQIARRAWLLRLAMRGLNAREAAVIIGCSAQLVHQTYNDPNFRAEVKRRIECVLGNEDERNARERLSLAEQIKHKSQAAFDVLCSMLDDPATHPGYRVKIAQDILNRNEETQAGMVMTRRTFDAEQLAHAAHVAAEMEGRVISIRKEDAA